MKSFAAEEGDGSVCVPGPVDPGADPAVDPAADAWLVPARGPLLALVVTATLSFLVAGVVRVADHTGTSGAVAVAVAGALGAAGCTRLAWWLGGRSSFGRFSRFSGGSAAAAQLVCVVASALVAPAAFWFLTALV